MGRRRPHLLTAPHPLPHEQPPALLTPCRCHSRAADLIRQKGDTNMTVEQLTQEIIPQGRGERDPARDTPRTSSPPLAHAPSAPPCWAAVAAPFSSASSTYGHSPVTRRVVRQ